MGIYLILILISSYPKFEIKFKTHLTSLYEKKLLPVYDNIFIY